MPIMDNKILRDTYIRYLNSFLAKDEVTATPYDRYLSMAYAVRSELMKNWIATHKRYYEKNLRRIYYMSTEYILGKSLFQNIQNLGIENEVLATARSLGFSMDEIYAQEDDCMLGNGSEGRLAACLMEALSTQGIPAMAYGIRYDFAQFKQELRNGVQVERPNDWLQKSHPWEIIRPEYSCNVAFGGEINRIKSDDPRGSYEWKNAEIVHAVPYDIPIVGYRNATVNTLRTWASTASEEFLPDYLNHGDYERACEDKSKFSRITQMLFPDEDVRRATDSRMKQQYFFVSATIQDIVRRYKRHNNDMGEFDRKVAIHLGGSRCALAIPELMRILVDREGVPWNKAWDITRNVFSYTSHAVFKEDSEIWPVYKVGQILPRHLQIIFDMNLLHLDAVRERYGNDISYVRDLSLVEEGDVKRIRFADIAVIGSSSVNGVSHSQTEVLTKKVFSPFAMFFPNRFSCKVNGVGQRRWLLSVNRPLSQLVSRLIGDKWIINPELLTGLERFARDASALTEFALVKKEAKRKIATTLKRFTGGEIDDSMMFDVQIGKIHTNKRQVLHVLYLIHRYLQLKRGGSEGGLPGTRRIHIFSGKATPSDFLAKQIIHLISEVARHINNDSLVKDSLRVVFVPDFTMSCAEQLVPAADLSEQLSTATLEPSGTLNMKFALNGAVTIASRSGANIEMVERIGKDNVFAFGKNEQEIEALRDYRPSDIFNGDERLKNVFSFLENELVPATPDGHAIFPLLSSLRDSDRQFVLLDFNDYVRTQAAIDKLYNDQNAWMMTGLLTIARAGWFSSDRLVREYAKDIWKVASA
jgi:glycogen phosphorylase